MLSFGLFNPDGSPVLLKDNAGVGRPAPPLGHLVAQFDRLLDPTTLEDTDGNPKAGIAVLQSAEAAAGILVTTNFVPNGDSKFNQLLLAGPSITVTAGCGMPSGAAVAATLELTKIRSHDQTTTAVAAADAAAMFSFTTEALAATTDVPPLFVDTVTGLMTPAQVDPTLVVNVTFNNLTPGDPPPPGAELPPGKPKTVCADLPSTRGHIHVAATLAGVPVADVAAVIAQDAADASKWTVSPPGRTPDGPGAWPAGAVITISVDATATDLFAQPLGTEASASFMVKS